jgi:hypothetical protein
MSRGLNFYEELPEGLISAIDETLDFRSMF